MNIVILNVDWDTDEGEEVISEDFLPILILDAPVDKWGDLDAEGEEILSDIISDETTWCHKGYNWEDAREVDQEIFDDVKKIVQYEG